MRLLSIIQGSIFGGAHNQALQLHKALAERGCQTRVILPDEPGDAFDRLRNAEVDVVALPLSRLRATLHPTSQFRFLFGLWPDVRRLRHAIREYSPDVVQVHGPVNVHGAIAGHLEGKAVVWQLVDTRTPMALRRLAMPLVTRLADVIMTTGSGLASLYPGASKLGDRLVPFVPPVDVSRVTPNARLREQARRTLKVPARSCVVGTIANRNPQKGLEYLVRAAALARQRHPDLNLRIRGGRSPGHQAYERRLQLEADAAGFGEVSLDSLHETPSTDLLPGFDIVAVTSVPRSEGIPTVILEAMACGLPVVTTDVGAVREVVEHDVTGLIVPPEDLFSTAEALSRLVADPERRGEMGRRGRERVLNLSGIERCTQTHLRAYQLAIDHRARVQSA